MNTMRWVMPLLSVLLLSRCTSCEPPADKQPLPSVGELRAVVTDRGVELHLDSADARVHTLSVDVALTGASATDVVGAGATNIVEDGLTAPAPRVTVVLADTRQIPLPEGLIATVQTDAAPATVALKNARAVDEDGNERTVTVVVP